MFIQMFSAFIFYVIVERKFVLTNRTIAVLLIRSRLTFTENITADLGEHSAGHSSYSKFGARRNNKIRIGSKCRPRTQYDGNIISKWHGGLSRNKYFQNSRVPPTNVKVGEIFGKHVSG